MLADSHIIAAHPNHVEGRPSPSISAAHRAHLRESGLSDETIAECGYHTVADPAAISTLIGWQHPAGSIGPCLAIPYYGIDGQPVMTGVNGHTRPYVRLRPSRPRKDKASGKPIKYESPVKSTNHVYIPPGAREAVQEAGETIYITEGEKKAAAATQYGFPCLALSGVWSWQTKRTEQEKADKSPRKMIPDLAAIEWTGRTVYIVFDSDAATNEKVQAAEWCLAHVLERAGATVRIVRLPAEPDGGKNGLDDYLVRYGAGEIAKLVKAASPPKNPHAPKMGVEIIREYFRERYRPDFKRGAAIHAHDGDTITRLMACDSPTSDLMARLMQAADAPRKIVDGQMTGVKVDRLPSFFRTWSPIAWGDLLASLPTEDDAQLGDGSAARETFRRLVSDALYSMLTLGDLRDEKQGLTVTQRRSVVAWAMQFAREGRWQQLRSFHLWFKTDSPTPGEVRLNLAVKSTLFAQLGTRCDLRTMTADTFARRCRKYGVGETSRTERPGGQRCVILDHDYVADLITGGPEDPVEADPETPDSLFPATRGLPD